MASPAPAAPNLDLDELATALSAIGLDGEIQSLRADYLGRFSNDVWRITLDNGVVLAAKRPHRISRPGEQAGAEAAFYRAMAGRGDLPIPRYVAEQGDTLLLEWCEHQSFDFAQGADDAHAAAAIDALADWHASFWLTPPRNVRFSDLADADTRAAIQRSYDGAWARHGANLREHMPKASSLADALVGRLAASLEPLASPATLIHSDPHAENLPLTDDGIRLMDWEEPSIANPGLDLAVFMTMSFPIARRRAVEADLLERYDARLRSHGCHWETLNSGYRLGLLRRTARIVEIASDGFTSLPWIWRRTAQAALDHEVHTLLR